MRTIRTIAELRDQLARERSAGRTVALVPTMGAFHDGHLALMRHARERCDVVVVSLFVNPTQFNEAADLATYPRDEARDAALAADAGVSVLFTPTVAEMYPAGFATTVHVAGVGETLEGAHRPGHFDGVATVVAKLLSIAAPDVALFGRKDAQQAHLVRRLAADLNLPGEIETCPTVREPDGLAMSSRNARLGAGDRARAVALRHGLDAAEAAAAAGARDAAALTAAVRAAMESHAVEPEYVAVVHAQDFTPLDRLDSDGDALVLVAARVGAARLIDNTLITTDGSA